MLKADRMRKELKIGKIIYLIPPMLVLAVLCIVFMAGGLYPFGAHTVSWCDMNQQVVPLLLDFKDILSGKGSMLFSLANAGGMNFWGVFFFFLSSPFSFLVAFVEKQDIILFMNILVMLKLMTCALSACIYFKRSHPSLLPAFNVILSTMYAFCGYGLMYYQNIIWLDMMYLFPLLLISFNKLIFEKKPFLYAAVLTVMIIVNYYISYMIFVFTIMYFGIYILMFRSANRKALTGLLAFGTCIALLLSGVVWIPSLLQYFSSGRRADVISGLISDSFLTPIYTLLPQLLCTAFIFSVISVGIIKRKLRNKNIVFSLLLLCIMLIPVFIEPINKMWHVGSYMSFPGRYGFITVFIGLKVAAEILSESTYTLKNPGESPFPIVVISLLTTGFAVFAVYFFINNEEILDSYVKSLWGNRASFYGLLTFFAAAALCYSVIYLFYIKGLIGQRAVTVFLLCILLVESCFNINVYIVSAKESTDVENFRSVVDLGNKVDSSGSFFRVKTSDKLFDVNMIGAGGYNSLSHYTSLTSQEYLFTMKRLGYSSYWMEVGAHGGTEFSDMILSNKYVITDSEENNGSAIYSNDRYYIRENRFYLPMGIISSKDLSMQKELPGNMGRIEMQEYIYKNLFSSTNDLFIKYPYTQLINCKYSDAGRFAEKKKNNQESTIKYDIYVKGEQTLYFDCFGKLSNALVEPINESLDISVNGKPFLTKYPNQKNNGILKLGTFKNEKITVEIKLLKDISFSSFGVYGLYEDVLKNTVKYAGTADVLASGRKFSAVYNAEKDGSLFLSVPYDKGFTVKINGQKTEYYKVYSDFIAIKVKKGLNKLSISYIPPGLPMGLGVTISGAVIVIALRKLKSLISAGEKVLNNYCYIGFLAIFWVVFTAIYIFPPVVNILSNI